MILMALFFVFPQDISWFWDLPDDTLFDVTVNIVFESDHSSIGAYAGNSFTRRVNTSACDMWCNRDYIRAGKSKWNAFETRDTFR